MAVIEKLQGNKALYINANMNEQEQKHYEELLTYFIENFPVQGNALKASLSDKNYTSLTECMKNIYDMLLLIKANDLAGEALILSNNIGNVDIESAEADLTSFLSEIAALSIDIQMSLFAAKLAPLAAPIAHDGQKLILAVDDASFFLQTLKAHLQGEPYKLICVTSGEEALRFIEKRTPDLFILDVEMPGMNGYELTEKIKERGQTAPVIFLTGNASKEYVIRALQIGVNDFIIKPVNKEQVLSRIAKYI
jgi:CheY-like chemotaxis protein